jgi:hypothetical protein
MPPGPLVRLTTLTDPIEARIVAARLGSEGVLWELRGGIDGPYPVGPFHIYVAESDLELAREVLTPADDTVAADGFRAHQTGAAD